MGEMGLICPEICVVSALSLESYTSLRNHGGQLLDKLLMPNDLIVYYIFNSYDLFF